MYDQIGSDAAIRLRAVELTLNRHGGRVSVEQVVKEAAVLAAYIAQGPVDEVGSP